MAILFYLILIGFFGVFVYIGLRSWHESERYLQDLDDRDPPEANELLTEAQRKQIRRYVRREQARQGRLR